MIALHKKVLFKAITSESGTNCLKKNYLQLNMKHFFTKYCIENRVINETVYKNAIHKISKCRADIPYRHRVAEERYKLLSKSKDDHDKYSNAEKAYFKKLYSRKALKCLYKVDPRKISEDKKLIKYLSRSFLFHSNFRGYQY